MKINCGLETIQAPIEAVAQLVEEVELKTTTEGIEITAMDPANVSMVIMKIPAKAFDKYEADNERFGINLTTFTALLKKMSDKISMEYKDNVLEITDANKRYTMNTLDLDEQEQKIPELKFEVSIDANDDLKKAYKAVSLIDESIRLSFKGNNLVLSAESKFATGSYTTTITTSQFGCGVKCNYSKEYLEKLLKPYDIGKDKITKTTLNFGKEYPLKIEYKLTNGTEITYILAPRIDDSTDDNPTKERKQKQPKPNKNEEEDEGFDETEEKEEGE